MLDAFDDAIWTGDGPHVVAAGGFRYPTRMAAIRLPGGGLLVWSPVMLDAAMQAGIEALGPVEHIVAPNTLHDLALSQWQAIWPQARLHGAPGLAGKRPDLRFDRELGDTPDPGWAGAVDICLMTGNAITTEAVLFHRDSGTAIFTDLLQQMPPGWYSGWRALIARWDGMTGDEPAVPRKFRLAFTRREPARQALRRIKAWPVRNVLMAHGTPVRDKAPQFLDRAFSWLER